MDENESIMSVQKPEQTECRFLLKAKKGEATPQREHLETPPTGEEDITNGLTPHIHDGQSTSVCSPGTSYWCVSETTDSPLLLSPVPGPSVQEPPPIKPTPGKDHRRYYHEYWRSEYLMDFDWQRHGMICMVCGSSLATLKLSTIKRHIKQKHPYSLLWSESDKEVIRLGWESHLNLENRQRPICSDPDNAPESKEMLEVDRQSAGKPESAVTQAPSLSQSEDPPSPPASLVQDLPSPTPQVLERYLNDSLHAWFRQEFLMEYQAEMGRLVCMVCSCLLPSLHLDHIKSHVLDLHPNSLLYSAEEKHSILQTWAKTHGEESEFLQDVKLEQHTKEVSIDGSAQSFAFDVNPTQGSMESYLRDDENISEADKMDQSIPCFPRKRKLKYGSPWRLRLDYLVAYGPPDNPRCYCMVCSEHLPVPRVSNFRKHIQACHPETSGLSRNERDALIRAWTKNNTNSSLPKEDDVNGGTADVNKVINAQASPVKIPEQECIKTEENKSTNITPPTQTVGRNRHYPGKDQRRNYQAHWRMDFLMDYDCKRHGLICMVCGATLATLKVSTIKRHVLQLHPHSMQYSPEEKQLVLLSYSQISLHLHSADCFSGSNHSHKENANGNTGLTSNQST